ncbi:MAG: mono/diheme cytochrome c family protein [Rhodothermales bacterium]|jgi:mono/diheme cytochrome c family protein
MTKQLTYFFALCALLTLAGCRGRPSSKPPIHPNPNMDSQFKYKAQAGSTLFADAAAMRPKVEGTVARGFLREDSEYYKGKDANGDWVKSVPAQAAMNELGISTKLDFMKRGQERYMIYCLPCHGASGYGDGIVTTRGLPKPLNLHDVSFVRADGQLYDTITNGSLSGNMNPYRHQVQVADRWAIVSYLRALQRSQSAKIDDAPEAVRGSLRK